MAPEPPRGSKLIRTHDRTHARTYDASGHAMPPVMNERACACTRRSHAKATISIISRPMRDCVSRASPPRDPREKSARERAPKIAEIRSA